LKKRIPLHLTSPTNEPIVEVMQPKLVIDEENKFPNIKDDAISERPNHVVNEKIVFSKMENDVDDGIKTSNQTKETLTIHQL
jgi:hypothetical protein